MIKNIIFWLTITILLMSTLQYVSQKKYNTQINYSNFISDIKHNKIKEVRLYEKEIDIVKTNNYKYKTHIPVADYNLLERLINKNIKIKSIPSSTTSIPISLLISWSPLIILFGLWFMIVRQIQSGNKKTIFFGKSKAKILNKNKNKITFKDVAGCNEAKEEVYDLVKYLKKPKKFQKLGGKIPKGILMVGLPGTGKTLLAKAIAGESKVPFFTISGSDFVEMFVGVGASRVRDMFNQAKKSSPCIIFIDEIDAVGKKRSINIMGNNHDEREQTLNQLLVEMDGFSDNQGIIIIAATNRPDVLDPALLRPGRFDRQVIIDLPDIKGREEIIKIHTKKIPLNKNIDISLIARGTPGFSGADLANLINEAALLAAKKNLNNVSMKEFEKAKDKIIMGTERKSIIMSNLEKEITAYHESGHTIVGKLTPEHDPVHKVTIIPRGKSLGITFFLPKYDSFNTSRKKLESQISTLYGGRIAEEIIYGHENISTGAANDIKIATSIAKKMVIKWGFSSKIGPLLYEEDDEENFFNKPNINKNYISEYTAKLIDKEIKNIIDKNYQRAKNILLENINILHKMKKALIKHETLNSLQIDEILSKK